MKNRSAILVTALLLASLHEGFAQGFINLNFESATITSHPEIGANAYTATLAGWSYGANYNYVNGDANSIPYNNMSLDLPSVNLEGTNNIFGPSSIQGKYSVFIQSGSQSSSLTNGASIMQTGQIPLSSLSAIYWGGAFQVSFNGQPVSFNAIGSGSGYSIWQADISAYAGQVGQLVFSAGQNSGLLDNIQFSSTAVPEPGTLALAVVGASLLGFRRQRNPRLNRGE